jgi:sugar O-acyltransferase (sialic acid O-acetyltransferase NeuD family)
MKQRIIGLGAGGHSKVVIETLREMGGYEIIGLLDKDLTRHGTSVLGVSVLGGDALLPEMIQQGVRCFFLGIGSVGDPSVRRRLFLRAVKDGLRPINVLHPRAVISPSAQIQDGICVFAVAVIHAEAHLGQNVIVNTAAIIEHDCVIGSHVHLASGARLGGGVIVGDNSHVGMGASVRQNIRIGKNVIVGAGSVVVKDVPDSSVVAGVPARIMGQRTPEAIESKLVLGRTGSK